MSSEFANVVANLANDRTVITDQPFLTHLLGSEHRVCDRARLDRLSRWRPKHAVPIVVHGRHNAVRRVVTTGFVIPGPDHLFSEQSTIGELV